METGDIQTDPDGTEWVILSVSGAFSTQRISRVKRNSLAHKVFSEKSPKIAESLGDDESTGISETTSRESSETT